MQLSLKLHIAYIGLHIFSLLPVQRYIFDVLTQWTDKNKQEKTRRYPSLSDGTIIDIQHAKDGYKKTQEIIGILDTICNQDTWTSEIHQSYIFGRLFGQPSIHNTIIYTIDREIFNNTYTFANNKEKQIYIASALAAYTLRQLEVEQSKYRDTNIPSAWRSSDFAWDSTGSNGYKQAYIWSDTIFELYIPTGFKRFWPDDSGVYTWSWGSTLPIGITRT
jgi:hypothetical protein